MGRGYSSFHRKRARDQMQQEQQARLGRNDEKKAARIAQTIAEGKAETERRNTLLANFAIKDKVTDGRYIGYVKRKDTQLGQLVVALVPSGVERCWSPDFINKIP